MQNVYDVVFDDADEEAEVEENISNNKKVSSFFKVSII